jgi:monoamine oxidase
MAVSQWQSDPYALGSYSCAKPGHADDRRKLAEPVEQRLFFAGEACSPTFFSTAHGAYASGCEAADQAVAALRRLV